MCWRSKKSPTAKACWSARWHLREQLQATDQDWQLHRRRDDDGGGASGNARLRRRPAQLGGRATHPAHARFAGDAGLVHRVAGRQTPARTGRGERDRTLAGQISVRRTRRLVASRKPDFARRRHPALPAAQHLLPRDAGRRDLADLPRPHQAKAPLARRPARRPTTSLTSCAGAWKTCTPRWWSCSATRPRSRASTSGRIRRNTKWARAKSAASA